MASTGKWSGIAVAPGDSWDALTGGRLSLGVAGMTQWSCRKGLEFPPRPDELGGPRSLPLPPH